MAGKIARQNKKMPSHKNATTIISTLACVDRKKPSQSTVSLTYALSVALRRFINKSMQP